jgi:hypothetical protein
MLTQEGPRSCSKVQVPRPISAESSFRSWYNTQRLLSSNDWLQEKICRGVFIPSGAVVANEIAFD